MFVLSLNLGTVYNFPRVIHGCVESETETLAWVSDGESQLPSFISGQLPEKLTETEQL